MKLYYFIFFLILVMGLASAEVLPFQQCIQVKNTSFSTLSYLNCTFYDGFYSGLQMENFSNGMYCVNLSIQSDSGSYLFTASCTDGVNTQLIQDYYSLVNIYSVSGLQNVNVSKQLVREAISNLDSKDYLRLLKDNPLLLIMIFIFISVGTYFLTRGRKIEKVISG